MAEMDLIIVFTSGMNEWKPTVSLYLGEDAPSASRTALPRQFGGLSGRIGLSPCTFWDLTDR